MMQTLPERKPACTPLYRHLLRAAVALGAVLAVASALAADGWVDTPMDETRARAMMGRLGYGATPATLRQGTGQTPRHYLLRAIQEVSVLPAEVSTRIAGMPVRQDLDTLWRRLGPGGSERQGMEEAPREDVQREMNQYAAATVQARLLTMANSDNTGREALLSFWLNHFSIYVPKGPVKLLAWDYIAALDRAMREDSFEALLRASFYHPAMQLYLDNAQSTAPDSRAATFAAGRGRQLGINENLARELLELHTLGVDAGYSQADVRALARIITGAGVYAPAMQENNLARAGAVRQGLFLFDPRRHDFGEKTFLGEFFPAGQGQAEIDRALQLMARHPATARRISSKLAQRFLADDPPAAVVDAMSAAWLRSGGRISATLLALLESPAFAASLAKPAKFKEPLDYLLSLARAACGDRPLNNPLLLAASAMDMGQAPLMHTTPDGYGSRESDWLSPAAMAKRTRLAIGTAAARVPLAAGAHGETFLARPANPQDLLKGTACPADEHLLGQVLGPPADSTRQPGAALSAAERVALRLASPEFMRR
ncbi:MAG: DUF1800 domain-containing protein [Hylemonella sp.]|nr:DUF1800 domain-containing protein [Hylemonella sp.]